MATIEMDCDMEFLKKHQNVSVSQGQVFLEFLSKFAKMLLQCELFQEIPFNHNFIQSELLEFLLHKFKDHFMNVYHVRQSHLQRPGIFIQG